MSIKKNALQLLRNLPPLRWADKLFCLIQFMQIHRRMPGSEKTFNNELFRNKVSDELLSPLRQFVSDKYLVKLYVNSILGPGYAVETLGYLRDRKEIENFDFPESCAIKPSHATGAVCIRKDNDPIDYSSICSWLELNLYRTNREANYRYLVPGIIVEPLVFCGAEFNDIKFHCYMGRVRMFQFHFDLITNNSIVFFNREKERLPFSINYPITNREVSLPKNIDLMIKSAEALAAHFSMVRIDMLSDGHEYLVGEITNISNSAHGRFYPKDAEITLSKYFFDEV